MNIWRRVVTAPGPSTFVGDVELMNVMSYIHRCHDVRTIYSSVPTNIRTYVCEPYIR
jgi:hypothetical protein